ncbi:mitochondrial ribosomal protein subunit-domain-containing protein [Tuber indicum]|nr:mitochondrial ribosomal protein subunit-domain-containing protein [Tuber indicum]
MASKASSPGANLLRHSRLFAMPKPLPPPLTFRLGHQDPPPYPTVQAITTPTASRVRGNWGLKRDVPHKITHTTMRVTELDTIERFMAFESANDDVLTLKKWQEVDMPLVKSPTLGGGLGATACLQESVFDDNIVAGESYKWKYLGPFLLDMPADEFKRYVLKKVKPRRKEFEAFVAKSMADACGVYESAAAADGETKEVQVNMNKLREDTMKFLALVTDFLDMPRSGRPYRTHPSAGLHYTRSAAHILYDPEHGPCPSRPVPGRSLNSSLGGAVVGIGGVAATLRENNTNYFDTGRVHNDRRHVRNYEPRSAYISNRGRIMMDAKSAMSYEEAIGMRGKGPEALWGAGGAGSVMDNLKNLVPQGGRKRGVEWDNWLVDPGGRRGGGNGDRGGLSSLAPPGSKLSGAFTRLGQAKEGGGREKNDVITDILANLTKS